MAKFKNGTHIYHSQYGAGTIIDTQKMDFDGSSWRMYIVQLVSGSTLMLPFSQDEKICRLKTTKAISDVLSADPVYLAEDYRQRRGDIETKINSGDQLQIAEVFRDLAWRKQNSQLSQTDKVFMDMLKKRLINILSIQTGQNDEKIAQWIDSLLQVAV